MRCLPIDIPAVTTSGEFAQWLENQPEEVGLVTSWRQGVGVVQQPYIEEGAYVDPRARLIGGIIIKNGCYVGPFAVIRMDEKSDAFPMILDEGSNVQDNAVVHSDMRRIGKNVIVAHQAIVHGAVVEDEATLYIQAVVDSGTTIGQGSFLHQGCYVGKNLTLARRRYVEPGQKILTQQQADELPEVPPELQKLREHVLEQNHSHTRRYLKLLNSSC